MKAFSVNQVEGKRIGQVNERAQREVRKGLLEVVKACVPAWKDVVCAELVEKWNEKYLKNEKAVLGAVIKNSEEVPLFDIEIL